MAKTLKIYNHKDPILRTQCRSVPQTESWVFELANDMWTTMLRYGMKGLAANQVGYDYNVIVINGPEFQGPMINPIIRETSKETFLYLEKCLSMPGYEFCTGKRSKTVRVDYHDLIGDHQSAILSDTTAAIVQHQIDHLQGIIMTDYVEKSLAIK
jgi:peptide deformylase